MDFWKVLLLLAAAAAEAAAAAAVNLTRTVGENVTLSLGHRRLKPGDTLVWSYGPETGKENVLFHIEIEDHDGPTKRDQFDLDLTTGALTINHLRKSDSAVYLGQIFNGNGTNHIFNLTVKEPDPIQPIHHIHLIWIIIGVVVLICLLVAFIGMREKIMQCLRP